MFGHNNNPLGHPSTEPQSPLTLVTLRNGQEEFKPIVKAGMLIIRKLQLKEPEVFKDLVGLARSMDYEATARSGQVLIEEGLLDSIGYMHPSTRRIVLSAATGELDHLRIVEPIASVGVIDGKVIDQSQHHDPPLNFR